MNERSEPARHFRLRFIRLLGGGRIRDPANRGSIGLLGGLRIGRIREKVRFEPLVHWDSSV